MKGMEFLILFIASIVLCVVAGYVYLNRENTVYDQLLVQVKALRTDLETLDKKVADPKKTTEVFNLLSDRLTKVEVDIVEVKKPQHMNVTIDKPLKVLYKRVDPISALPGLTPEVKKQVRKLSQ